MKIEEKILRGAICRLQKIKQPFRTAAGLLAGLMIFGGITHVLDQMFVSGDEWVRILWHHFYEDAGNIDNIYLGSSHVFYDIDPTILDQLSGQYNFNLATPAQRLNGSYYLLKEADRTNTLSHVYLELYYGVDADDGSLLDYRYNWANTDFMKPSLNRTAYWFAIGGPEQYINALLPFSRYRACLGNWNQIKGNMKAKEQEKYKNYQFEKTYQNGDGKERYERQGACKSTGKYKDGQKLYQQDMILTDYSIGEKSGEYCYSITEYCKEREIPITLFISPIYDLQLISTVDYDDYTTALRAFAEEQGVPFYDFNLVREEYLPIQDGKYFWDSGHLNQYGAEKFTPFFYQVVSGEETENKKYFCDSYAEKLRESAPAVYGIYAEKAEEGDRSRRLCVASNRDTGMEYRIILTPDGKRRRQIQDFQDNMTFQVPLEEHGICTIAARVKETPTEMWTMSVCY